MSKVISLKLRDYATFRKFDIESDLNPELEPVVNLNKPSIFLSLLLSRKKAWPIWLQRSDLQTIFRTS